MRNFRHMFKGSLVAGALFGLTMSVIGASVQAQEFPSKPIRIVAHTSAGSATDLFARELAEAAAPVFGQPVVVVNRPGGGGATQMAVIRDAEPDGYTVGVNTATHVTSLLTTLKGQFNIDDFAWIIQSQTDPFVLAVSSNSPYKTLEDLVNAARSGEKIKIGGYGAVGAAHNIAVNVFADAADMPFTWVNYPGAGDALTAALGNHVDAASGNPGGAMSFVEGGRMRILGIMNEERIESLPDVPTYVEAGYDVDTSWKQIRGLIGPKDIPMDIQQKLADGFFKAMESPRFKEYMKRSALVAGTYGPTEYPEFAERLSGIAQEWLDKLGVAK